MKRRSERGGRERERERGICIYLNPNKSTDNKVPQIPNNITGLRPHKSDIHPQSRLPRKLPTKNAAPKYPACCPGLMGKKI